MQELIKINYNEEKATILGRDLHEFLGVATSYKDWFPRMCEYGFSENIDFCSFLSESTGGRPSTNHQLTIEMAKEISMIQRTDKGKQARQYFIECEKKLKQHSLPKDYLSALKSLVIAEEEKQALLFENEKMKPKAHFFDIVTESKDCCDISTVAKIINIKNIGRNKLFEILRDKKILQHNNQPMQYYIDRGWFKIIETKFSKPNGDICINFKTVVFQKGIDGIIKLLEK